MVAANIRVILRIRPSGKPSKAVTAQEEEGIVNFDLEQCSQAGQINNSKSHWKFKLDGIMGMKVSQEEVFNIVAKPVVEDVLQGINGTIFAYGQSGSGKTFTITGGAERYQDRGLIPRTIAYLFEQFKQRGDATYRMYVSYLEIYNDAGYDLLSREENAQKLEDLPKVQLREDEDGNIHLRNLSVNMASKAEDALNLLFLGDTNRVVAETPLNDASTRSHCMFILWVDATKADSDSIRRAKLHLVDLAGSERIGKTGVEGNLQKEARYINLSLHYLEQVIVALQERSSGHRTHVPYRNSMMTSVLRDSLGGNCRTVMVGTLATEEKNLEESISTCRFAQRVACIKNNATINEELDPALLIRRLKKEVAEMKDELKLLSGEENEEELTEQDIEDCRKLVSSYLAETDMEAKFVCGSISRYQQCFRLLKDTYNRQSGGAGPPPARERHAASGQPAGAVEAGQSAELGSLEAAVLELREQVGKRDQEIGMLVNSLSKRGKGQAQATAKDGRVFIKNPAKAGVSGGDSLGASATEPIPSTSNGVEPQAAAVTATTGGEAAAAAAAPPGVDSAALLLDRNKAFEVFRKSVRRSETLEDNKEESKKLYLEAKDLGDRANSARTAINAKKGQIEKMRLERALEGKPVRPAGSEERPFSPADSPEVVALLAECEEEKKVYHKCTERLKHVKAQIDAYKAAAEQNKQRLQRDFEAWYMSLQASQGVAVEDDAVPAVASPQRSLPAAAAASPARPQVAAAAPTTSASSPPAPAPVGMMPSRAAAAAPAASTSSASTRATPPAGASPAPSSRTAASSAPQAAGAMTGDEQTDNEIAAYFAAMADLRG